MKTVDKIKLHTTNVYIKTMRLVGAVNRFDLRAAKQALAREEGQGTIEYILAIGAAMVVAVVLFAIARTVKARGEAVQTIIENLPNP